MKKSAHPAFRKDIQALRATAVSFVVVGHLWPGSFSGGYVGVDVFFVISGFLITSHLLNQAEKTGQISLPRFWANRAIRILPAALVVLAFSALCTLLFVPEVFWQQFLREVMGATIYIENWVLAVDAADYWAADNSASPVRHYWSLSVEEQFYIFMPMVLVAALNMGTRWRLWYGSGLIAIVIVSLVYSVWYTNSHQSAAYFVTTTRVWEFAMGSLLALLIKPVPKKFSTSMALAGLVMIIAAGVFYSELTAFPGYMAALPVVGTLLVIWANKTTGVLGLIYSKKSVQLIGDISYAIYLWHWPLIIFAGYIWQDQLGLGDRVTLVALTIFLAWISTRFFEDPIRFKFAKKPHGRKVILGGIAGGMALLLVFSSIISGIVEFSSKPYQKDLSKQACLGAAAMVTSACPLPTQMIPGPLEFTKDDGGRGRGCWATKGVTDTRHCTLGTNDSQAIRVAAIGDSHSNSLVPAFEYVANELGWTIDVFGKNGCYLTTADLYGAIEGNKKNKKRHFECLVWRENIQKLLDEEPYDLLLVTHWEDSFLPDTKDGDAQEVAGLLEAWQAQIANGSKIIALTDTPKYTKDVIACIAKHQLKAGKLCSVPNSQALPKIDSNSSAAALLEDAVAIDTRRYFCTKTECLALIGGVPVLFNQHHITGTFARSIGPLLTEDISKAMVELGFEKPKKSTSPNQR